MEAIRHINNRVVRGDQRRELPDMPPRMLQSLHGQLATTPFLLELLPDVPCVMCCSFMVYGPFSPLFSRFASCPGSWQV